MKYHLWCRDTHAHTHANMVQIWFNFEPVAIVSVWYDRTKADAIKCLRHCNECGGLWMAFALAQHDRRLGMPVFVYLQLYYFIRIKLPPNCYDNMWECHKHAKAHESHPEWRIRQSTHFTCHHQITLVLCDMKMIWRFSPASMARTWMKLTALPYTAGKAHH